MIIDKKAKRLAIYFFYDQGGIVDQYVLYFLADLKKNVTDVHIVCNGKLEEDGRHMLEQYGTVVVRENKGYDVWAYKESLLHFGWKRLELYDEVIMLNSTIMGPIFPLEESFDKMSGLDIDFWGLTEFTAQPYDPSGYCRYGYVPDHIQSHFIVCRQSLFESEEFRKYWEEMPMIESYWEAVGRHEMTFTKYFEDLGYKSDIVISTKAMWEYSGYPLMMCPIKLIEEQRCPIFKRRMFFNESKDLLDQTAGEQVAQLFKYIETKTDYNVEHIWETILRNYHQADIVKNLNLSFILPEQYSDEEKCSVALQNNKIALVMHLYFEDLLEESLQYVQRMPKEADVFITTDTDEKKEKIRKVFKNLHVNKLEIRVIENRGRDVSSLLVGVKDVIMDYDIACFAHDKKTAQVIPGTAGAGFAYKCFKNTLASSPFIMNVIETFEANPRLGMLSPPEPNHGPFFPTIGKEWRGSYELVKSLATEMHITIPISEDKPPVAPFGTMFWFRPKAMKPLYNKEWQYGDFPPEPNANDDTLLHAVERLYPFVVQQSGYYPGILMSNEAAQIEYGNLKYYVREYNNIMMQNGIENSHRYMCEELRARMEMPVQEGSIKALLKQRVRKMLNKRR